MSGGVDLYDNAYSHYEEDVYPQIRLETYGEDFGQTSWVTTQESNEIPLLLNITSHSHVIEIGCGSGRYALQVARQTGCHIVGVDINPHGIRTASEIARRENLEPLARFEAGDASKPLSFAEGSFDAAFSNDAFCHLPDRLSLLRELKRVLKPKGRILFSDALVIGGLITAEEIATRSAIGPYVFGAPGVNEDLIKNAGLQLLRSADTTENAAAIANRWREARQKRERELAAVEGKTNFDGLQRFLACVQTLSSERRLLRYVYLARKDD